MASYLFADTGTLIALGKAGLLDTLLPANNGGRVLVITQEIRQELIDWTNRAGKPGMLEGAAKALAWIQGHLGDLTLLPQPIPTVPGGADAGERSVRALLDGVVAPGGFQVPQNSDVLFVHEDPAGAQNIILPGHEKQGLIYPVRVRLDAADIEVDGKRIAISPGMAVSAEIVTGDRRVIEYVLSPILRYRHESARER